MTQKSDEKSRVNSLRSSKKSAPSAMGARPAGGFCTYPEKWDILGVFFQSELCTPKVLLYRKWDFDLDIEPQTMKRRLNTQKSLTIVYYSIEGED